VDLLVDRDGLRIEAVLHELGRDLQIGIDGLTGVPAAELEVADLQLDVRVARVGAKERLVVLEIFRLLIAKGPSPPRRCTAREGNESLPHSVSAA
jgi:hypothetical protein